MDKFKGALVVGFLRLFALLPWRAVQGLGSAIGWLMWKLPNRSREVARINLDRCFPELANTERERLLRASLQQIGKTFTESACAWIWPADKTLHLVKQVEGLEVLEQALASGKGVVGITSHLGNWEVLNHFYCAQCKPIIFYRPPKLKGGAVGIPADPEPSEGAGVFVPFLGTQALTSKFVPGMLTGGKAVGVFLHALRLEDGSGYKVILEAAPPAMYDEDVEVAVAAMSGVIERYVRTWPSQYMWTMKRFKKRPAGERRWY